jgi:hypothetical protein
VQLLEFWREKLMLTPTKEGYHTFGEEEGVLPSALT